ncbi:MAG: UDP-N-acetylglucosamine 2-epimerase (hydrolyzing) [Chloroflexi bacterium]|nr:MAG: UDP-N-acetylglucosamine 2-epimerase (hydrolyzing) [Chloroflexota bacterium]
MSVDAWSPSGPAGQSRRRVLFVTGTRADFGKLKPLIREVACREEFEYRIFATGMHMLSRYGLTVNEIYRSGFDHIYPYVNQDGSVNTQMDLVLANTIQGLGHFVREFPPDLIVVHGDRVETLAGAIVGALNNTLVAHIEGGEISGTVDELIRHAVSKLSHLHFVANDDARVRLMQMGETCESISVIGSPDVDVMLSDSLPSMDEVRAHYDIAFGHYGILLYHPVTTEVAGLRERIATVVSAVQRSDWNFVVLYPNNDTGSDVILETVLKLQGNSRFRCLPSMRFEYFLTLLKHARAVVGNSSCGVREAPVYGVPSVNIGTRQANRYRYPSIVDVLEDETSILAALDHLPRAIPPSFHFGRGQSAKLFVGSLQTPRMWATPRQKQFRDMVVNGDQDRPREIVPGVERPDRRVPAIGVSQ